MPIVDVPTHMFRRRWLELLRTSGGPYGIKMHAVYSVAAMTGAPGPRQLDAWAATISNRNG